MAHSSGYKTKKFPTNASNSQSTEYFAELDDEPDVTNNVEQWLNSLPPENTWTHVDEETANWAKVIEASHVTDSDKNAKLPIRKSITRSRKCTSTLTPHSVVTQVNRSESNFKIPFSNKNFVQKYEEMSLRNIDTFPKKESTIITYNLRRSQKPSSESTVATSKNSNKNPTKLPDFGKVTPVKSLKSLFTNRPSSSNVHYAHKIDRPSEVSSAKGDCLSKDAKKTVRENIITRSKSRNPNLVIGDSSVVGDSFLLQEGPLNIYKRTRGALKKLRNHNPLNEPVAKKRKCTSVYH